MEQLDRDIDKLANSKFPKLFSEFLGFVSSNSGAITDPYECTLTNLVINHFDAIAEAGTSQGQRGRLINSLIQENGLPISSTILMAEGDEKQTQFPFVSLSYIEVAQFRGFSNSERIPLDRRYNLVYGPNGSGKSSLCEALEYSLLGYINEANSRRIELSAYIQNRFTGIGEKPVLTAINASNKEVPVSTNPSLFGFAFIEKNRIESFGRISANTPAAKQNLLASLFGLSDFNDFVTNFTKNIEKYVDIVGNKQKELRSRSESLTVHRDNLKVSELQIQSLQQSQIEVGKIAFPSISMEELTIRLNDSDALQKEISTVTTQLSEQAPYFLSGKDSQDITNAFVNLKTIQIELEVLLRNYLEQKEKVAYRDLFAAVVLLQVHSPDKCPVCETPIEQTLKHPYENARGKLKDLMGIVQIEDAIKSKGKELRSCLAILKADLEQRRNGCTKLNVTFDGPNLSLLDRLFELDDQRLSEGCFSLLDYWKPESPDHLEVDKTFSLYNLKVAEATTRKEFLRKQLENLTILNISKGKIESEERNVQKWTEEIEGFNTQNALLIKEAEDEKSVVERNRLYVDAYNSFLSKLNKYKDELPLLYVKELNDLTLEIYNLVNSSDRRYEKACRILLPSMVGEPIQIAFADNPESKLDVLNIFSEGHLRCLGLSILLAKNIQSECPIVIFDDVVNAIDDDHRGGIRSLLFTYEKLLSKQIILTTHAELFVKELEQHVKKADYDKMVRKLSLILDQESRLIRVRNDSQKNYLHRVNECVDSAEWKDALYFCRCCLESLTSTIWNKIGNKGLKTEFSVVIRTPNGQPDLMSIVCSLNRFLKRVNALAGTAEIIKIFDYLIGLETSSNIIWYYLNKGTHEQEGLPEFDCAIVRQISEKLLRLDEIIK